MAGAVETLPTDVTSQSGDPRVIGAVVEALTCNTLGMAFRRREQTTEFRELLRGAVRRISLFVEDPDWRDSLGKKLPRQWNKPYLSSDDWD